MNIKKFFIIIVLILCGLQLHCSLPTSADVLPPVVLIIYPYEGSVLSGMITIVIESTDENKVSKVWYYLDGLVQEYSGLSNPKFQLDITLLADERTHIILAAAADNAGNIGYTTPMSVRFSKSDDITAPTVQILNPINTQTVHDTVHVVASASDDRSVREVAFFIDADSVISDSTYPYEYIWSVTNLKDSSDHALFVKAFDSSDNWAISAVITVTVYPNLDRTPPRTELTYPLVGQILSGIVPVRVEATDDIKLDRVEFYIDGNLQFTVITDTTESPFTYSWDTTPYETGSLHSLFIKAIDAAGNQSVNTAITFTVGSVDVIPPTAQLVYPVIGQNLNGKILVTAEATDDIKLDLIEFYTDGNLQFTVKTDTAESPFTYLWDTTPYEAGSLHSLFIKALDAAGNQSANTPVTFTVGSVDIVPPTAQLIYPVVGDILSGEVQVMVDAKDDKQLDRVEFYIDGNWQITVKADTASSPFNFLWDTTPYEDNSEHTIFFKAFDAAENQSVNLPITFTVGSGDRVPPTAQLIYPILGQILSGEVQVVVDATDDKQLDRVEFYIDGNLKNTVKADTASSPFNFLWDTTPYEPNSQHTLFFKAFDAVGNQSVNLPITFLIGSGDLEPPTIVLLFPSVGDTLSGSLIVKIDVTDNVGIEKVEFYVDGGTNGSPNLSLSNPPWSFPWNTAGLADGRRHTLYIKAYDLSGNIGVLGPTGFPIK